MMYPECALCGRKADEDPSLLIQTLHGRFVCSPCVLKDAKDVLYRESGQMRLPL